MRLTISRLAVVVGVTSFAIMPGCAKDAPKASAEAHHEHDGHDHSGHDHSGHDHSAHDHDGHDHSSHDHSSIGPHHGELIELGNGRYHAELVHDEQSHTVRIYLLDTKAIESVAVSEQALTINVVVQGKPTQFELAAAPLDADPSGHSSHFQRQDESLCDALHEPKTQGRFNVVIEGKNFVGTIRHCDHDHDHEHPATANRIHRTYQ